MSPWVEIAIGLLLLVVGGELIVRGSVATAKAMGVSPLMIGLTLVGFGTSTPELVTSVTAALQESPGIALGNVIGSNTANILLILGLTALIYPLAVEPKGFARDTVTMVTAAAACLGVVMYGHLGRNVGALMILALLAYVAFVYRQEMKQPDEAALVAEHRAEDAPRGPHNPWISLILAIGGIAMTIFGARFLVHGSIEVAQGFGISDTIIGLTIVAVGTSTPELITSVTAAFRKHPDVAYGNIIGSNIYNILFILGLTGVIQPVDVPAQLADFDVWMMLAATGLLVCFARSDMTLTRAEGGVFLVAYAAYTAFLVAIA